MNQIDNIMALVDKCIQTYAIHGTADVMIVDDGKARQALRAAIEQAIKDEREACAKVCDALQDIPATEPRHCAQDIRLRSEEE